MVISGTNLSGFNGVAFNYQIVGSNYVTSFGASNLPAALSVNTSSGIISGTPSAAGTNVIALLVTNAAGNSSKLATIAIGATPATGTYYVASTGTDIPGNGSIGSPWRTLEYATGRMLGGDILYVRGGTYTEVFDLYGPNGSAGAYTKVLAYPGETPIFNHSNPSSSGNSLNALNFYVLGGLTIHDYQTGLYIWGCSNTVVTNLTVYRTGQEGIHVQYDCNNVTVVGNTVYSNGLDNAFGEGIYCGSGDNVGQPVDNCHDITISSNIVHDALGEAIEVKGGTYNVTVQGNTVYTCNKAGVPSGAGGGAIEVDENGTYNFWNGDPLHVIRGNVVYDTPIGIRAGTGQQVYNNVVYSCTSSGILVNNNRGDSYVRYIYNNTVDQPIATSIVVSSGLSTVWNNIGPTNINNYAVSSLFFVNYATHDYHLVNGSILVDTGAAQPLVVLTDFDGLTRPNGVATDIGAYELQQNGLTNVVTATVPVNLRVIPR